MSKVDYERKYKDLRTRFVKAVDVAYRLGFEQGQTEAAMAAQQEMMAAPAVEEDGQGTAQGELGAHIEELEGMVRSENIDSEAIGGKLETLKKSIENIESLKNIKKAGEQYKQAMSISGGNADRLKNLKANHKEAVNYHEKVVSDIFRKWEAEGSNTVEDIASLVMKKKS